MFKIKIVVDIKKIFFSFPVEHSKKSVTITEFFQSINKIKQDTKLPPAAKNVHWQAEKWFMENNYK